MKRIAILLVLAAATSCTSGPQPADDGSYSDELTADRATKDRFMAEDRDSPIPADKKSSLLPLKYFPADPAFAVPAALRLRDDRPVFPMPTSTGTIRRWQLVGTLEFTLEGQPMTLGAFVEEGTRQISSLFVPFADQTTGTETYPAGRYLDLHPTATGYYTIDFNRAYNPYCAYNSAYECPYPPPANRLKIPVRAGEKIPGSMMRALQAVIFDFDGVIANSEPLHLRAFQKTLADEGQVLTSEEYFSRYLGYDDVGAFERIGEDRGLDLSPSKVAELVRRKGVKLKEIMEAGEVLFPGAADFIRASAKEVPIAIASGALRHEIDEIVTAAGLAPLFSAIVASGDTPSSKPSSAPYQLAFERLKSIRPGIEAHRCVAIEDSRWGLLSAAGAGLRCVGVTTSYGPGELSEAELIVEGLHRLTLSALDDLVSGGAA